MRIAERLKLDGRPELGQSTLVWISMFFRTQRFNDTHLARMHWVDQPKQCTKPMFFGLIFLSGQICLLIGEVVTAHKLTLFISVYKCVNNIGEKSE